MTFIVLLCYPVAALSKITLKSCRCYLKQPQVAFFKSILCQSAVKPLREATQVADQAAEAAKGQRARTRAGIPYLQPNQAGAWHADGKRLCRAAFDVAEAIPD